MHIKLFDGQGLHQNTYVLSDKAFDQWMDEAAETFFERGGYAELWNDREVYRLHAAVQGKSALKRHIRTLGA
jgi:hypothetical protein